MPFALCPLPDGGDAFLLESVEGAVKWGRYSFLGIAPQAVFRSKGKRVTVARPDEHGVAREVADPFAALKELLSRYRTVPVAGLPRFSGGLVGYLGYDLVRFFERLPERAADDLDLPDQYLMLVDSLLVFDNTAQKIKVVAHAAVDPEGDLRDAYDGACARIEGLIGRLERPIDVPARFGDVGAAPPVRANLAREEYEALAQPKSPESDWLLQKLYGFRFATSGLESPDDVTVSLVTAGSPAGSRPSAGRHWSSPRTQYGWRRPRPRRAAGGALRVR